MLVPSGLLISCLALLNVASCSTPTNANSTGWNCQETPSGFEAYYGFGRGSQYQPYYITDDYISSLQLFSSSGENCSVPLKSVADAVGAPPESGRYQVYQVSSKLLYVFADWLRSRKILAVDASTCASYDLPKKLVGFAGNDDWMWAKNLINYDDGFDEIVVAENETRIRYSYDLQGNRLGEPKAFAQHNCEDTEFYPISPKSRASNLVADCRKLKENERDIDLVDADGRLIKRLLHFDTAGWQPDVKNIGDSMYGYCSSNFQSDDGILHQGFECGQFDELGRVKYSNSTGIVGFDGDAVGLRNLKSGGIVLFVKQAYAANRWSLNAVEMRPGADFRKTSYPLLPTGYRVKVDVADFDEDNRRFTVRVGDKISTDRLCWNTFSLPSEDA